MGLPSLIVLFRLLTFHTKKEKHIPAYATFKKKIIITIIYNNRGKFILLYLIFIRKIEMFLCISICQGMQSLLCCCLWNTPFSIVNLSQLKLGFTYIPTPYLGILYYFTICFGIVLQYLIIH